MVLLTGLLGTVDALWLAFHSIDVLDSTQKQVTLARGMAGALNPTAFGLLAAMLILLGYQVVKNMALRLIDELQHGITVLYNLLVPTEPQFVAAAPLEQSNKSFSLESKQPEERIPEEKAPLKEALNDASIEDIKDEEEII